MKIYLTKTAKIVTLLIILILSTLGESVVEAEVVIYNDGNGILLCRGGHNDPLHNLKPQVIQNLEIPRYSGRDEIIRYSAFTISYNEEHEQANWVAYELTREETYAVCQRYRNFISDQRFQEGTADDKDYHGSGYDRGHLAPAGDMAWSETAMRESFFYSNISPQDPGFNRGIWKDLEELVREWAKDNQSVYIVVGPILEKGLQTIGRNKVSVPKYYYKVILDYREPDIKGIGFVIPNKGMDEPLQKFALSIDNVEKLTGIDFFCLLPDEQEELIESTLDLKKWKFDETKVPVKLKAVTAAVQCRGITKAGKRCRNTITSSDEYCHLHKNQNNRGQN